MVKTNTSNITIPESDTDTPMTTSNIGYSMLNHNSLSDLNNPSAELEDSAVAQRPTQLDLNEHNGTQFQGQPLNSPTTSDCSSSRTQSSSDVDELCDGMAPALPSKQPISTCTNSDSSRCSDWSDASGHSQALNKQKPDGRIRVRTICLLGALLPGIGCYICIAYTYLFQLDRVMNFTTTECPDVKR
ncbi:hypothetical protein DdX_00410 [Ditylenchus destructor]|uniref:Uncharacterized protein n=1 Tax=Ditylenchus destructor TaxID=166010 RepID=A0AAD4NJZ0_9BILA|nr:hypothetical protein DdX_00410 [Ditylenchus destructor]